MKQLLINSLRADLEPAEPFKWNDYVLGYVAFADGDGEALDFHIHRLGKHASDRGNTMNLVVLRKLRDGLGRPYGELFPKP